MELSSKIYQIMPEEISNGLFFGLHKKIKNNVDVFDQKFGKRVKGGKHCYINGWKYIKLINSQP